MLSDHYHDQSAILMQWFKSNVSNPTSGEPVWNSTLINGIGSFNCTLTSRLCNATTPAVVDISGFARARLRIINTGVFASFNFSIDGLLLTVIEVDGITVIPYNTSLLEVNVAQRYSVIVSIPQPAQQNYWIRSCAWTGSPWTSLPDTIGIMQTNTTLAILQTLYSPQLPPESTPPSNLVPCDQAFLIPILGSTPPNATKRYFS